MYPEGQLLCFAPFVFKNGAEPKKKYYIVLKHMDDKMMMASLPTSKNHIPSDVPLASGCINIPERAVNAYVFFPEEKVTDCFSFVLPTFVYGEQVDEYSREYIENMKSEIEDLGKISDETMANLRNCLKQSVLIKRKYRKLL